MPDNRGYLTKVAIIQKFFDRAISANTNYDPSRFEGDKVPMMTLLSDLLLAYKMELKRFITTTPEMGQESVMTTNRRIH